MLAGHPDLSVPLGAQQDRTAAEHLMDGVDTRREPRLLFQCIRICEERLREAFLLHEFRDDHTSFLVAEARPPEVPAALEGVTDEGPVVAGPVGDDHETAGVGLGRVFLETVRDGEDDHLQGD